MLLDLVRGRDEEVHSPLEVCGELVVRSSTGPTATTAVPAGRSAP